MNKMYTLNSDKHEMYVNEVNKISMSPCGKSDKKKFDDKRYIRPCDKWNRYYNLYGFCSLNILFKVQAVTKPVCLPPIMNIKTTEGRTKRQSLFF